VTPVHLDADAVGVMFITRRVVPTCNGNSIKVTYLFMYVKLLL
jgi:hypothetical protein